MLVLEKLAIIYVQLVVKHGCQTMTNRQFRNFAKSVDLFESDTKNNSFYFLIELLV